MWALMLRPVASATSGIISHKIRANYVCIKQKRNQTHCKTYILMCKRERESLIYPQTPGSPLHSKPHGNPKQLYNQPSGMIMDLYLSPACTSSSVLSYLFISPGTVTYWR